MIIDAHVHFTPPAFREALPQLDEPYLQMLLAAEGSIQDWVSAETMLADMDKAGIDRVILVGEYFQRHENCVARNNLVLELINKHPSRISAYAIVQPNAGDGALAELARCLDGGMVGLGEMNPYAQGFDLLGEPFLQLATLCAERNVPINLHVGEPVGRHYTGKSTTPLDDYHQLALRCPSTKFIFAHWGGGLIFYEMMPHMRKQLANVWYDTAASPLLYPTKRIFRTALACVAPEKLLYGSDYPLRIYPGRMNSADFQPFLSAIRKQNLGPDFETAFFRDNYLAMEATTLAPVSTPAAANDLANWQQMPVRQIVKQWPEMVEIFGRFDIPTQNQPLPNWESAEQAIAAATLSDAQRTNLVDMIDELVKAA